MIEKSDSKVPHENKKEKIKDFFYDYFFVLLGLVLISIGFYFLLIGTKYAEPGRNYVVDGFLFLFFFVPGLFFLIIGIILKVIYGRKED